MTGCTSQAAGDGCARFTPYAITKDEVVALRAAGPVLRPLREWLVAHNETWKESCAE